MEREKADSTEATPVRCLIGAHGLPSEWNLSKEAQRDVLEALFYLVLCVYKNMEQFTVLMTFQRELFDAKHRSRNLLCTWHQGTCKIAMYLIYSFVLVKGYCFAQVLKIG